VSHLTIAVLCICRRVTGTKTNKYYCMAPRLSGQNCIFVKFPSFVDLQMKLAYKKNKYTTLYWNPRSHIDTSLRVQGWHRVENAVLGWVCCWFSLCLKGYFSRVIRFFSLSEKPTIPNSNSTRIQDPHIKSAKADLASSLNIVIYLFNFFWASAFKRDFAEHFTSSRTSPTGGALGMSTW